jgi:WD40 repeat-containing protein SMU1
MLMDGAVHALACSPDSTQLAAGSESGQVKIWEIATGKCHTKFHAHTDAISALCFLPDATQLLTASTDHTIKLFGLVSKQCLREFRGHSSFVNDIAVLGHHLVSVSSDASLRIWDLRTAQLEHSVSFYEGAVSTVAHQHSQALQRVIKVDEHTVLVGDSTSPYTYLFDIKDVKVRQAFKNIATGVAWQLSQSSSVYVLDEMGNLARFSIGKHDRDVMSVGKGLTMGKHPSKPLFAVLHDNGHVALWRS